MPDDRILGALEATAKLHAMPPTVPVSTEVAAMFLGYSPSSLENMRRDGTGPAYIQPSGEGNKKVKYQLGVLLAWMEQNTVISITAAAIRDGKVFAMLSDVMETRPFWTDEAGMLAGLADESTVSEAADLILTHDIVWLPVVDAVSKHEWSEVVAHAMLGGRVSAILSHQIQHIAAKVESSELRDMLNDAPDPPPTEN